VTARERDGGVGGGGTLRAAASPSPTPPTPLSLSLALALSLARLSNVESCYLSPATLPAAFLSRPPPRPRRLGRNYQGEIGKLKLYLLIHAAPRSAVPRNASRLLNRKSSLPFASRGE